MPKTAFLLSILVSYGGTIIIAQKINPDSKAGTFIGFMLWFGWPVVFATILGVYHFNRFGY